MLMHSVSKSLYGITCPITVDGVLTAESCADGEGMKIQERLPHNPVLILSTSI